MHLAAHRKNSALAFNRLVDLTEGNASCRVSETDTALAALAKSDQPLSLEELEDLPHYDRVGVEAFRDCLRSRPLVAGVSDETHDVDGTRHTTVHGHKQNSSSYIYGRQPRALRPTVLLPFFGFACRCANVSCQQHARMEGRHCRRTNAMSNRQWPDGPSPRSGPFLSLTPICCWVWGWCHSMANALITLPVLVAAEVA